jgi:hypothetical protein
METASIRHPPGVYATGTGLRLGSRLSLLNLLLFSGDGLLHKCITTVWFLASPYYSTFVTSAERFETSALELVLAKLVLAKNSKGFLLTLIHPSAWKGYSAKLDFG